MRPSTLTGILFVAFGYTATGQQFSLLPQLGVENTRTTVKYNNISCFSPLGAEVAPRLGARLAYQTKTRHGAFVGLATNRSVVALESADPQSGMHSFASSPSDLRLQLEAGYQLSTKPIYFNKSRSHTTRSTRIINEYNSTSKKCGGSSVKSHCGRSSVVRSTPPSVSKNKGWFVSIKPSVGAAFVPGVKTDVITKNQDNRTSYVYNAGNWNTALITGAAFEFGNHNQKKFTVSLNHLQGIGNLGQRTISTASEGKTMVTNLRSNVSNWNLTAGIPISLGKKNTPSVRKQAEIKSNKNDNKSWQYKSRCRRVI